MFKSQKTSTSSTSMLLLDSHHGTQRHQPTADLTDLTVQVTNERERKGVLQTAERPECANHKQGIGFNDRATTNKHRLEMYRRHSENSDYPTRGTSEYNDTKDERKSDEKHRRRCVSDSSIGSVCIDLREHSNEHDTNDVFSALESGPIKDDVSSQVVYSLHNKDSSGAYESVGTLLNMTELERERIHEQDKQINLRQQMNLRAFNQDKLMVSKKMIYILGITILLLILCLILILPIIVIAFKVSNPTVDLRHEHDNDFVTESKLSQKLDEIKEEIAQQLDICMPCTDKYISRANTYERDGLCCISDSNALLKRLMQRQERLGDSIQQDIESLQFIISLAANGSNTTDLIIPSSFDEIRQQKGAIHLVGNYRGANIEWFNEAASSNIALSRDSSRVTASSNGNYFLYAKVIFDISSSMVSNGTVSYRIYQGSGHRGTKTLESVELAFDKRLNKEVHTSSVHRVVYLTSGDEVFLHFDAQCRDVVSRKIDIHEFGMFEI